jgi:Tol biopolymer transport system component
MSVTLDQVAALRRLSRVYRRILLLVVPAALAGCGDAGDAFAPEPTAAAGDLSPPAAAEGARLDLAALATDRIVFSSLVAVGSDVWTMSPAGTGGTRLTSFTGTETHPVWSPDRKRIAFERARNGLVDIYLMDADGTHKRWARPTAAAYSINSPSWSPDGSHLLVQVWLQGGTPCVARLDIATGNLTLVAPAGVFAQEARYPIYDKEGKSIFYVDRSLENIRRFTPGGTDALVLTGGSYVGDLALSPDGTRLAYYAYAGSGNSEIYVLNLATSVAKRLTSQSKNDYNPAWSPDGTKLAFSSNRSGKLQIYTMNSSTGGGLLKITSKTYGAYQPAWFR